MSVSRPVEAAEEATDESSGASTSSVTSPHAPCGPGASGEAVAGGSSDVFIDALAGQVNQEDVYAMIVAQRTMLSRVEKSNEMLVYCNQLATARYLQAARELKGHTQLLQDSKRELDNVFRRIREIKQVLSKQHPQAFQYAHECERARQVLSPVDGEAPSVASGEQWGGRGGGAGGSASQPAATADTDTSLPDRGDCLS